MSASYLSLSVPSGQRWKRDELGVTEEAGGWKEEKKRRGGKKEEGSKPKYAGCKYELWALWELPCDWSKGIFYDLFNQSHRM